MIGDFNETYNQPLPENERETLLKNCLAQVQKLHENYPDKKILVCSDSITFLQLASKLDYVFIVDGKPVHTAKTESSDINTHLKTFVDFFMIAGAQKVFLLLSGKMYNSGFPYVAALVNNREFEIVRF